MNAYPPTRISKVLKPWQWLVWLGMGAIIIFAPAPAGAIAPQERTFRVHASAYQYSPATIHVNTGDQVTIELISTDVVHGIYIDGYGLSQTADPGQAERLSFTANQPGTFRLRCSVTCGALHPFMTGKLVVGSNTLIWRSASLALLALAVVFSLATKRT